MNINSITTFIEKTWEKSIIPALKEYITLPAIPLVEDDWALSYILSDS